MSNLRNEAYRQRQAAEAWHEAVAATERDEANWRSQRLKLQEWMGRFQQASNPAAETALLQQYNLVADAYSLAWRRALTHFMEIPDRLMQMTDREALVTVVEACLAGIYQAAHAGGGNFPNADALGHEKAASEMADLLDMLEGNIELHTPSMIRMIEWIMNGCDLMESVKHGHGWSKYGYRNAAPHNDKPPFLGAKRPDWKGWCEIRRQGVIYGRKCQATGKYPTIVK